MMSSSDIQIHNLDHLGLVAGIIDEIGIVEIINERVGIYSGEIVTAGQVVKAILLNGLGFVSRALYLFAQFFSGLFKASPCQVWRQAETRRAALRHVSHTNALITQENPMKTLQQPLVIALFVTVTIVCFSHIWELIEIQQIASK